MNDDDFCIHHGTCHCPHHMPENQLGAQPTTEMDEVETAEQCERCGGYADNCPCPKGNA